jgi:glutamine amidotransferase
MHNGQVGGWSKVRRRVEAMIPDELYNLRYGSTDSEAILLSAMAAGLEDDPPGALSRTLATILSLMEQAGVTEPLRLTAAISDGERLWAFRWSSDSRPPSLYWREDDSGLVVVSEPIDDRHDDWHIVPPGGCLISEPGEPATMTAMPDVRSLMPRLAETA